MTGGQAGGRAGHDEPGRGRLSWERLQGARPSGSWQPASRQVQEPGGRAHIVVHHLLLRRVHGGPWGGGRGSHHDLHYPAVAAACPKRQSGRRQQDLHGQVRQAWTGNAWTSAAGVAGGRPEQQLRQASALASQPTGGSTTVTGAVSRLTGAAGDGAGTSPGSRAGGRAGTTTGGSSTGAAAAWRTASGVYSGPGGQRSVEQRCGCGKHPVVRR